MGKVKKAYDLSRKNLYFCSKNDRLTTIANLMHSENIGSVLVRDKNRIIGIITVNNLLREMSANKKPYDIKAHEIMSYPVVTAHKDTEIDDLMKKFDLHTVSRLVLVDDMNKPVGVVKNKIIERYSAICKYNDNLRRAYEPFYARMQYR